jgi:hypothetical protein
MTGVLGTLDSGRPGKTILLRADMDSLPVTEPPGCPFASEVPGRMHACGHDGHVAMLLGAAKYLAAHRELFCGRIVFCFQPAEENSRTKKSARRRYGLYRLAGAGCCHAGRLGGCGRLLSAACQPPASNRQRYISRREAMATSDSSPPHQRTAARPAPHKAVDPSARGAAYLVAGTCSRAGKRRGRHMRRIGGHRTHPLLGVEYHPNRLWSPETSAPTMRRCAAGCCLGWMNFRVHLRRLSLHREI